jgi:hypothetical protein
MNIFLYMYGKERTKWPWFMEVPKSQKSTEDLLLFYVRLVVCWQL